MDTHTRSNASTSTSDGTPPSARPLVSAASAASSALNTSVSSVVQGLASTASAALGAASSLINLQSLIDLSAALNASDDDAFILNTALLSVMGKLRTFKASAFVRRDAAGNRWFCAANKGFRFAETVLNDGIVLAAPPSEADAALLRELGIELTQEIGAETVGARAVANGVGTMPEATSEAVYILCFGAKLDKHPYSDEEQQYVSLVASITANALQNAANLRSLRETGAFLERKNQLLTTLFEVNREFSTLLDREEILKFLSLRLMGQLAVTKFSLLVKDAPSSPEASRPVAEPSSAMLAPSLLRPLLNRLNLTPEQIQHVAVALERSLAGAAQSFDEGREAIPEQSSEASASEASAGEASAGKALRAFVDDCTQAATGVVLALPMSVQNEVKGVLLVGGKMNKQPFRAEEENFLAALASTAMTALENARLFDEELEKKRLEEELNVARHIQKGLLPTELPPAQGFDVAAFSVSSKQIGGDYYDVLQLPPNPAEQGSAGGDLLIVIADVSGKGTPAALLMANTQAAIRVLAPLHLPLPELVARLNDMLFANTSSDKFVTFFCARLSPLSRTLTFVNAGHNPPMLLRGSATGSEASSLELLSEGGLILGIMESLLPYEEKTIELRAGDTVLMFTDGVSEALNAESVEFGDAATEAALRAHSTLSAADIVQGVVRSVEAHVAGAAQSDDITLVVLKCT
jgi:phosphoserine phosphatase RsbU/P